jgi:glycosyltransferase involved in cell wall biosynthesis
MSKKTPHVAFLFTNDKDTVISDVRTGKVADTALHGMNHFPGANYFTIFPQSMSSVAFIPRLLRYDFIVAQDNFLLGYVVSVCARALHMKTRWFYMAIHSSTLMRRHAAHPVRRFLLKTFWASYACIICISLEQLEDFARLGIPRTRLVFIPFGVDTHFFQPADVSREEDLMVSVGRDAGRDYSTLFKAAERTKHTCIVVAGHKNIPSDMPIPANISVLYNRSLVEIRDLYARARFVVVPSKDASMTDGSDCSGQTVILDALAAGKAVIATRHPWISDYFVPNRDLIVVDPNNPEALTQAINSLWQDAEKRKRLAAFGHDKVVARYTTQSFAEALRRLMDSFV